MPSAGNGGGAFSIIGADVIITGDVHASSDLHIDGRIEGDLACAALVQGTDSRIKGQITARSALLAGQVEGAIDAGELVIEASARITGDIRYDSITVSPGAQIDGRFTHKGATIPGGAELKLVGGDSPQG